MRATKKQIRNLEQQVAKLTVRLVTCPINEAVIVKTELLAVQSKLKAVKAEALRG